MNLAEVTEVGGVKLTQPEKNLLTKLDDKYAWQVFEQDHSVAVNPYTGVEVVCDPVIGALVEFVQKAYRTYGQSARSPMTLNGVDVPINTFDRVRHLVLRLDPKVYSMILD